MMPKKYHGRRGRTAHGKVIAMDAVLAMEPEDRRAHLLSLEEKMKAIGLAEAEHNCLLALRAVFGHRE